MAIDFDALRKKLNQISGNSSRKDVLWRPQEGEEHTVRILSFQDNDGQPFQERWFYYNIGNNPGLLAPYQFSKDDPIQELINKLRDDGGKESYELAKKLYPKMRTYAPVIVRGEGDKGVQIWGFGKMVYQSLLNIMLDEDYGDITDPTEGRDVKVVCTKLPGRKWATTEVRPRGKATSLSDDTDAVQDWMSNIPDPTKLYECKTYDELSGIVNAWLSGDGAEDSSADTGTERGGNSTENTENSSGYSSLDDAFADLVT